MGHRQDFILDLVSSDVQRIVSSWTAEDLVRRMPVRVANDLVILNKKFCLDLRLPPYFLIRASFAAVLVGWFQFFHKTTSCCK